MKKYLKTIDLISLLKEQGHNVQFKKRSDGGYFITQIDDVKFKKSTGNTFARKIVSAPLPQTILKQRIKLVKVREQKYKPIKSINEKFKKVKRQAKKVGVKLPVETKKELLELVEKVGLKEVKKQLSQIEKASKWSKGFKKQFEKTKQAWEANENINKRGKISAEITLKSIERVGLRETKKHLKNLERYALGYANSKNVGYFIQRVDDVQHKFNTNKLDPVIVYCRTHEIKDSPMQDAYEILYLIDHGAIPCNTAAAHLLIKALSQ